MGFPSFYCIYNISGWYVNYKKDLLFMNDNDFIYDPDYSHWKDISEPKDFQFEADLISTKQKKKLL